MENDFLKCDIISTILQTFACNACHAYKRGHMYQAWIRWTCWYNSAGREHLLRFSSHQASSMQPSTPTSKHIPFDGRKNRAYKLADCRICYRLTSVNKSLPLEKVQHLVTLSKLIWMLCSQSIVFVWDYWHWIEPFQFRHSRYLFKRIFAHITYKLGKKHIPHMNRAVLSIWAQVWPQNRADIAGC